MTQLQAGKEIKAEQAQKYIQKEIELKQCLQNDLLKSLTSTALKANPTLNDTSTFYNSNYNAFIFDRELVMRFFEPEDKTAPKATYLMVLLGAKYLDDDNRGNPTVIVAGVNPNPGETDSFLSLPIEFPGTEQPPHYVLTEFPTHGFANNQLLFKIQ